MRQIGINFESLNNVSPELFSELIKENGFSKTFTKMYERKKQVELAKIFNKFNIKQETIHGPFSKINDIWLETENGNWVKNNFIDCIDNCCAADVSIMVVHLSAGETPPSVTDVGRRRFTEIIEYACKKGITLAFENQRKLSNISWIFETFGNVENVKFCWDCGHESCFTKGIEYMPLFGGNIICTHIHDNFGTYNDDCHLIPFDGKIDYTNVVEYLKQYNYQGSVMLELKSDYSSLYENLSASAFIEKASYAAKKLCSMLE